MIHLGRQRVGDQLQAVGIQGAHVQNSLPNGAASAVKEGRRRGERAQAVGIPLEPPIGVEPDVYHPEQFHQAGEFGEERQDVTPCGDGHFQPLDVGDDAGEGLFDGVGGACGGLAGLVEEPADRREQHLLALRLVLRLHPELRVQQRGEGLGGETGDGSDEECLE